MIFLTDHRAAAQRTLRWYDVAKALLWQLHNAAAQHADDQEQLRILESHLAAYQRYITRLENDARAPWLPQNSPTGQARLEQGTYVKERVAK